MCFICMLHYYHIVALMGVSGRDPAYLHDAVPIVARRDLEQGEEGHTKVLECGVTTHALARVVCIANCRSGGERMRGRGERGDKERETGERSRRYNLRLFRKTGR